MKTYLLSALLLTAFSVWAENEPQNLQKRVDTLESGTTFKLKKKIIGERETHFIYFLPHGEIRLEDVSDFIPVKDEGFCVYALSKFAFSNSQIIPKNKAWTINTAVSKSVYWPMNYGSISVLKTKVTLGGSVHEKPIDHFELRCGIYLSSKDEFERISIKEMLKVLDPYFEISTPSGEVLN